MPPKRPLRRPPGPAVPSRIPLHTQELMLFSSPITAVAPTKRTPSTTRRTSGSAAAQPSSSKATTRSASQRRHGPPSSASSASTAFPTSSNSVAPRHPVAEYEPLPEHYRTVPCAPTVYSSEIAHAPSASLSSSLAARTGGRVPSPPPSRNGSGGASSGIVASGSSSRVVRLLRDARAAVQDPIRPETPLDTFHTVGGATFGSPGADGGSQSSSVFPKQPPHSIEPRLRRRLPAGGRLAPMLPSETASPLRGSSPPSLPPTSFSSPIDLRVMSHQHSGSAAPTHAASAAGLSLIERDTTFDAEVFAQQFSTAQHRGEEGLLDCVELLGRLREWLSAPPPSSSATTATVTTQSHALGTAATACLQATLLHFCAHWPNGEALRNAVANYSVLSGNRSDVSAQADGKRLSRSVSSSVPLNYAEVALLAAAVMLRSYPAASLLAEPISFQAILDALHTIAACGVAEWVAQEPQVLEVLLEVVRILTAAARTASGGAADAVQRNQQWTLCILEVFAGCCEEASLAALTAAAATTAAPDTRETDGPDTWLLGASRRANEQDMIRGHGLADDVAEAATKGQRRAASASLMSSTTSLNRPTPSQTGSSSPHSSTVVPQGSPLSVLRHGSGGEAGQQQQQEMPANALKAITERLVGLGLLPALHELSAQALQRCASCTTASTSCAVTAHPTPFSTLPVLGSLYRLLAQFHADALRTGGVMGMLVSMLQLGASDSATVEAAARALVKLTFDDACLSAAQEMGTTLIDAAAHALLTQLRLNAEADTMASIELLVSRLCGVLARVAEGSASLQEHLATPALTHALEVLAQRYLMVPEPGVHVGRQAPTPAPQQHLPSTPVLQSIVWVLGIAAMSPKCSLHLVECVTPLLASLLQRLRELPSMQTTAVYVLMCLSNLSYFFSRFEVLGDAVQAEGAEAAEAKAEWLSTVCGALGFSLAAYVFEDNVEATVEATRILGNISYTNAGRDWMETNRCDEVMVLFLGHADLRIVYNCCGVLLNLTAASPCRVVEDAELLGMMLSYTARYTRDDSIAAAAAVERERLRRQRQATESVTRGDDGGGEAGDCAAQASSSAAQIADLVEKLLHNVHGLLSLAAHSATA